MQWAMLAMVRAYYAARHSPFSSLGRISATNISLILIVQREGALELGQLAAPGAARATGARAGTWPSAFQPHPLPRGWAACPLAKL